MSADDRRFDREYLGSMETSSKIEELGELLPQAETSGKTKQYYGARKPARRTRKIKLIYERR